MKSTATTVTEYLNSLPPDRKEALTILRRVIKKHLPKGYVESMNWGMIMYEIPLKRYPITYNKQPLVYAGLASQKNHLALYVMCAYADKKIETWFKNAWKKSGKKLDMGKSCIRFKKIEDIPLEVVGELIGKVSVEEYIALYEKARGIT